MTSYSVERPTRSSRVRPGLAHLRAGQVTTGQPVTIRSLDTDGREIEFPAVYVRTDGHHFRCIREDEGNARRYRPSQVFPRRVEYRRWTVTLKHKAVAPDGDGNEFRPVFVTARTELEARVKAVQEINRRFGERASYGFTLHSVKREG